MRSISSCRAVAVVALRQPRRVQRRNGSRGRSVRGRPLRRWTRRYSSQRDEFHHLSTDTISVQPVRRTFRIALAGEIKDSQPQSVINESAVMPREFYSMRILNGNNAHDKLMLLALLLATAMQNANSPTR